MANRRNRIIYASQSVHAEGRILYRVKTFGSSTTFNTADLFELGQLNLVSVVDDSPNVAVTLEGNDYGSIYTMATLSKVPTQNLHHNIRQSDGVTFFGTVSGSLDVSNGDLDEIAGLPSASGTGKANIVIKDGPNGNPLAYLHGAQLIDFGRECGISKGVDIYSPVQAECALGTASAEIEMTKLLKDVFINKVEFNYQSNDLSMENYNGETEQKQWLLNDARFLSWEEFHVGNNAGEISAGSFAAKTKLKLSLASPSVVATLEDQSLGFLKRDLSGRAAILFTFAKGGNLAIGESKAIPVFDKSACIPSNVLEYFLYNAPTNELEYYENGLSSTLAGVLPAARSGFINGDKVFILYAADAYAKQVGDGSRPVGADATFVSGKYFAPIGTEDVEDIGGIRQGQVEAFLVDPDLIQTSDLTGATIGATSIAFSGTLSSQVDLTRFIGLKLRVTDGPGKNGPAREITAASNNLVGAFNNGTITLGGSAWPSIRLTESSTFSSSTSGVGVTNLCGIDNDYAGSSVSIIVSGSPESATIDSVDVANKLIVLDSPLSGNPDNGSEVLVSAQPTTASKIIIGDYELSLRLQSVNISADLAREQLKEMGHLNPYARTLTLPIKFTVTVDTTAGDLSAFAKFAGKGNKFESGQLTNLDIVDLLSKENLAVVVMVYQQTNEEAGGNALDRRVLSPDMFGDEYFVNGVRNVYDKTDGSLREYPLKTVIAKNLRITDESMNTPLEGNATQNFTFRGTNEVTAIRGYLDVALAIATIESQGD